MDPKQAVVTQQDPPILEVPSVAPTPLTPPTMPVETNIPMQESPKKGSLLMKIAIILVLVAVLAIAAYVFRARFFTAQSTPTSVAVATPTSTQEVTITTDKLEYVQGETAGITVRNGLGKSVWRSGECGGFSFWGLQKLESSEWKWLDFSLPYLEKEKEICDFILCERAEPVEFKSGSEFDYDWRLSICEWPEKPIGVPKTEPKRIEDGTYRISFTYGLNKEGFDLLEEKKIYSNEFTIGEKMISKSECKEKSDGTPCTVGLWYDELGRACGDQSCVGLGLGKCYKGECIYLEEYENLSKNPQTNCLGSCKCMEECNKEGPVYFIPVKEGSSECSVNSVNKTCCCSGV